MGEDSSAFGWNLDGLSSYGTSAPVEGYQLSAGFMTDVREAAKLDAFVPAMQGDSRPWWERVAEFGLTRAIDSHYGAQAVNKTGTPGTFAGQNGRTYVNTTAAPAPTVAGVPVLLLAAIAAAFLLLR